MNHNMPVVMQGLMNDSLCGQIVFCTQCDAANFPFTIEVLLAKDNAGNSALDFNSEREEDGVRRGPPTARPHVAAK